MPEYFVSTACCFQAQVEMEQIRSLLQQELQTKTQEIVTAKKEGHSEESLRSLYDQRSGKQRQIFSRREEEEAAALRTHNVLATRRCLRGPSQRLLRHTVHYAVTISNAQITLYNADCAV